MSGEGDRRALALETVEDCASCFDCLGMHGMANELREALASLRTPPSGLGGDGGAEAMQAACVRWHEGEAARHDALASVPGSKIGFIGAHMDRATLHRQFALALGALKLPDPSPDQGEGDQR